MPAPTSQPLRLHLGKALADDRLGPGCALELLGLDGKHLGLVGWVFRHDDERRRALAFDVELDAPDIVDVDPQGDSILTRDDQATVRDREVRVARLGCGVELFSRFEMPEYGGEVVRLLRSFHRSL